MLTDLCQRWTSRRASYRPKGEPFDPRDYEVAAIADDTTARAFVQAHHYSASYPAARFRYGFYSRADRRREGRGGGELVGVAVFSTPARAEVTTNWMRGEPTEHVELGRFVLLDHVRANAESWMIARCFDRLRHEGITGVVSFSDPCPRVLPGPDGRPERVFGGHIGTIYQATNAVYAGRSRARTLRLFAGGPARGRVFSDRTAAKLRVADRGHAGAAAQLVAAGAEPPPRSVDGTAGPEALRA